MRKSTLKKFAMAITAMLTVSVVFAQTDITVNLASGGAATSATIRAASAEGTTLATATGNVITYTLVANTRYVVISADLKQRYDFTASATQPQANFTVSLTPYSETNGTDMYQTVGTTFRLFVKPDPIYSPNYQSDGSGINANSYWTWTFGTLVENTAASTGVAIQQNYVELVSPATAGTATISVVEQYGASGCVSSTTQNQIVNFVAAPSAVMNGVDASAEAAGFTVGTTLRSYYICNSGVATSNIDLTVIATEVGVPAALASYSYAIVERKVAIDDNGTELGVPAPVTTTITDHLITSKVTGTWAADASTITESGVIPSANLTYIAANTRTKVQYYLASTAGVTTGSGIVSAVSHKSDYVSGGVTGYTFNATPANYTVEFILNLPPVTGPIYHIPNNFNF